MKRYNSFFKEKRMSEYKAWYSPESDYFRQFSTNGLHSDISQSELGMDEIEAVRSGYYRIFVGHELDIDSWIIPTDREFNAVKNIIEENSYKKFDGTRWSLYNQRGFYFFPKQSFLFANSINDGILKRF